MSQLEAAAHQDARKFISQIEDYNGQTYMCVCMCVCVCVARVNVCVRLRVCARACMCVVSMCLCLCLCVCARVCVRERQTKRNSCSCHECSSWQLLLTRVNGSLYHRLKIMIVRRICVYVCV